MSNNIKISYNKKCIIYNIYNNIQDVIFKYNGIIFGGFVRDTIIKDYYSNIYWKNKNLKTYNNFWNEKYDLETFHRTTIPKDIDVCLYEEVNVHLMMNEITSIIVNDFGLQNVKITTKLLNKDENKYFNRYIDNLYKYEYTINVGAIPYITKGTQINIMLDIVVSNNKYIMPPFNKLDFLCNGFVMTRNSIAKHKNINLSSSTGTDIDNLDYVEKKEIEYKIMKDIINFRTDYCFSFTKCMQFDNTLIIKNNEEALIRIQKLISSNNFWTIGNMPIIIKKHINDVKKCEIKCCICFDNISAKDRTISVPILNSSKKIINGSQIHCECFFKYLNSQIQNKLEELYEEIYDNNEDSIILKCPMRNKLDFNCKSITNIIEKYLHS